MMKCVSICIAICACAVQYVGAAVSETGRSAMDAARSYGAAVRLCDMGWAFDSMYPPLKNLYAEQFSNRNGHERENARRIMQRGNEQENPAQVRARMESRLKALREYYVKMGEQMKSGGMKIESYIVHEPVAEYVVTPPGGVVSAALQDKQARVQADQLQGSPERSRLVVLPTTIVVSGTDPHTGRTSRVERRAHIYAIRDELVSDGVDRRGYTRHGTKLNQWYFADGNTDISILRTFFPNLPPRLRLPDGGDRPLR